MAAIPADYSARALMDCEAVRRIMALPAVRNAVSV
ncbi:hypothetical protein AHiyo4_46240 [Arthrobacter sp. Hiyo4]|nr:hypothetical protein AHiyo4_46240 [Arthrobacter sp. Hiyo4]